MAGVDISLIEPVMLRENYLVFLIFPAPEKPGFIPLRVLQRELLFYQYDPVKEGVISNVPASTSTDGITNLGFVIPQRSGSNKIGTQPINVLRVTEKSHLYQVFVGIDPPQLRLYVAMPPERQQKSIDILFWSVGYSSFGWIDGFTSPIDAPSPLTEIIIPPDLDVAFGFANPLPVPVHPLLLFVVNRLRVGVVRDVETIVNVLEGRKPAALKTVGGLNEFPYNTKEYYGISPIPLDATRSEITRILEGKG
jgi:hypothetical protein